MTDKLKELMSLCKGSISIKINEYKNNYRTIEQGIADIDPEYCVVTPREQREMLATGNIIDIQCYPETPVGFCGVVHHDLDRALEEAVESVKFHTGKINP